MDGDSSCDAAVWEGDAMGHRDEPSRGVRSIDSDGTERCDRGGTPLLCTVSEAARWESDRRKWNSRGAVRCDGTVEHATHDGQWKVR
jgi:hypothetical protein